MKAVWDRTPPHAFDLWTYEGHREWKESREPAPAAEAGDLESGPRVIFEVKGGERIDVKIKCDRPGATTKR